MAAINEDAIGKALQTQRKDQTPIPPQEDYEIELVKLGVPNSSQSQLSRVERGRRSFYLTWPDPAHRLAVLKVYGFDASAIRKLDQKFDLGITHLLDGNVPQHGPTLEQVDLIHFPIYESASAGTGDGGPLDEDPIPLPKTFLASKGADPTNVMLVKINGDCMVSHESRFGAKGIAHGDYAIVEIGRPPAQGDRQMFWDEQAEHLIIKYVGEGASSSSVTLYDERGQIYHRPTEDPELIYRGVVLGRFGMY